MNLLNDIWKAKTFISATSKRLASLTTFTKGAVYTEARNRRSDLFMVQYIRARHSSFPKNRDCCRRRLLPYRSLNSMKQWQRRWSYTIIIIIIRPLALASDAEYQSCDYRIVTVQPLAVLLWPCITDYLQSCLSKIDFTALSQPNLFVRCTYLTVCLKCSESRSSSFFFCFFCSCFIPAANFGPFPFDIGIFVLCSHCLLQFFWARHLIFIF